MIIANRKLFACEIHTFEQKFYTKLSKSLKINRLQYCDHGTIYMFMKYNIKQQLLGFHRQIKNTYIIAVVPQLLLLSHLSPSK